MEDNDEVVKDVSKGLEYIRGHEEISNVLLTGGDPLLMSTGKLEKILRPLRAIDHVRIIRIGTKMPALNPYRILDDPELPEVISRYSTGTRRIYIVVHFNHPRELTDVAIEGLHQLRRTGALIVNQTPLLRGINDDPFVMSELFNELSFIGVAPYYVFQCRPTLGNKMFSVPVEWAYKTFEQARMNGSGLAKRARFVMSHATGKIEVIGLTKKHVYFKYHRAHEDEMKSCFLVYERNPKAHWLDDYDEAVEMFQLDNPFAAEPVK
jgi:KamA family protein